MSEHTIHSDTLAVAEIAVRLGSIYAQEALLDAILEEAIRLSNADGGSLYLVKNGQLEFNLVKNLSLNLNFGREQKLPDGFKPIPISEDKAKHLCVYAVVSTVARVEQLQVAEVVHKGSPEGEGRCVARSHNLPQKDVHADVVVVVVAQVGLLVLGEDACHELRRENAQVRDGGVGKLD